MSRVLVTGAEGFIGKHVVKALLSRGYEVEDYDLSQTVTDYPKEHCDVLYEGLLNHVVETFHPDTIVHLAGQVHLQSSLDNPRNDALTNIIGTINVLETARHYGSQVIFSSSGAVYGSNDRSHITEYHDPEPISPYGLSKLIAEKYCLLYNNLYNVPVVVFRFSSVYGQGRKKTSVNLILDKAIKNETINVTGDGSQTRDFTHVSDIVEAILMAVERKFPSGKIVGAYHSPAGVYNIGTGTSTSINQLIKLLEGILQKPLKVQFVPKQEGDPLRNDFDVSKAAQYGFKTKVSLKEGIERLVREEYENSSLQN